MEELAQGETREEEAISLVRMCSRCGTNQKRSVKQRWCKSCRNETSSGRRRKYRDMSVQELIKMRARDAVKQCVRKALIKRQPCLLCGDSKSEAHHLDYARPLLVVWVCRSHHQMFSNIEGHKRGVNHQPVPLKERLPWDFGPWSPPEFMNPDHIARAVLNAGGTLPQAMEAFEHTYIENAIELCGGDKSEAANRLGIGRNTLYRKGRLTRMQKTV